MISLHFKDALTADGWRSDVRVTIENGRFASVVSGMATAAGDERHALAVPGLGNLHSHAFQRGMAGLAEVRGPNRDSFWSWREVMYRFALSMTPEHLEAIAGQLYAEMLEQGFTHVGEFHYLHNALDGSAYANPAEMATRIAAAAAETGIGLTVLPVFYAHASFGGVAPNDGQRRFINGLDSYQRIIEGCRAATAGLVNAGVGVAPHSLRAVTPEELAAVVPLAEGGPVHIHIAEQTKEVEDCLAWSGQRPVEWLLEHAEVDGRWCLVHATHMTDAETIGLARTGAVAGLCPITEANLGDGIFNAVVFREAGGQFGVGSDSNVLVSLPEELRLLEYSQRLQHRARNVLSGGGGSTGRALFDAALTGGQAVLGGGPAGIATGAPASFVTLDTDHPALIGRSGDAVLDAWIFASASGVVDGVWSQGRQVVSKGRHHAHNRLAQRFKAAIKALQA